MHSLVRLITQDNVLQITRLEKLHEKGFVHCDLKPDNILIGLKSEENMIYLIDFGLAHSYLDSYGKHIKHP